MGRYTGLLALGVLSLWCNMWGLGFVVFVVASRTLARGEVTDSEGRYRVQSARFLAALSILLFFASWAGLAVMGYGHREKWREREAATAQRATGAVQQ